MLYATNGVKPENDFSCRMYMLSAFVNGLVRETFKEPCTIQTWHDVTVARQQRFMPWTFLSQFFQKFFLMCFSIRKETDFKWGYFLTLPN